MAKMATDHKFVSDGLLDASTVHSNEMAITTLSGELDIANVKIVHNLLNGAADVGARVIVCDISDLTFMDSTGVSAFLTFEKRMKLIGGTFTILGPTARVERLFEILGATSRLTILAA
jgi:anti-sigma B factor antagonist